MAPAEAYLVEGATGFYEPRSWIVAAFTDRAAAEEFAAEAREQSLELHVELEELRQAWFDEDNNGEGGPHFEAWCKRTENGTATEIDPRHDFNGGEETTYVVLSVALDPVTPPTPSQEDTR